jgi:hypothetical protein
MTGSQLIRNVEITIGDEVVKYYKTCEQCKDLLPTSLFVDDVCIPCVFPEASSAVGLGR